MKKVLKISDIVLHILLALLYIFFIYVITTMFTFLPWYDANELYLIKMLALWLPLSLITILVLLIKFLKKEFKRLTVCLTALNAVYIPLIFCLGFLNIQLWLTQLICVFAVITMILYFAIIIKNMIKNR